MLTAVERVSILRGADLLNDVGPRRLLVLADVAREVEIFKGDTIYKEDDPADALYMVVEGRVRLSTGDRATSEVGPGEAFGTWSLVDDSARGHRAECAEDGLTLALHRDDFYDVAAGDLTLLQEVVRALAKRLRALVIERPDEARVEGEGVERTEAHTEAEAEAAAAPLETAAPAENAPPPARGAALQAAATGRPLPEGESRATTPEPPVAPSESAPPESIAPVEPPKPK
jgi:CRP-like cAMP-binding protein